MIPILRVLSFASIILFGLVIEQVHATDFPFSARPNRQGVRVRVDSTVSSPILGELHSDSIIHVIEEKWSWYKISLPSEIAGFVHADYVGPLAGQKVLIAGHHVNVRSAPSRQAPVIGQLDKDTPVEFMHQEGEWVSIRALPMLTGYVHSNLLTKVSTDPSPTDTVIASP